jgi:NAD(P)-dependent dehydrogenase (short-subunit alcohol dehydrogenase family)
MDRRDALKTLGLAAAGSVAATAAASETEAQGISAHPGVFATPRDPADPLDPFLTNVVAIPDDYFIPGRFAGKTVIVTGCARGMGRMATVRLAREGANVVGVDWLQDEGAAVVADVVAEGGKAGFVFGDVSENAVCDAMVKTAVDRFGGLDCALNNAGVMDAVFPGEPIDYAAQKDLVMARIDEATDEYWDVVMRVNVTGVFKCMRTELRQMLAQKRGGTVAGPS